MTDQITGYMDRLQGVAAYRGLQGGDLEPIHLPLAKRDADPLHCNDDRSENHSFPNADSDAYYQRHRQF